MKKFSDNLRLFFSNKLGLIGTIILVGFILVALFAPQIAPYDPYQRIGIPFGKPSIQNLLGTNDVGQDILSDVIYGTRISLLMGLLSAGVALIIGTIVGLTSGFFGGRVDTVLMRMVDISLVIPMLSLMILLAAFLGPSFWNIVIVIGVLSWASPARVIRSQVLTIKNKGYIVSTQ